jgi:hypothetical protein
MFTRGEAEGAGSCPLSLSTAEIKNGGAIPPLPYTSSWRGASLIKLRDNLKFYFCLYRAYLNNTDAVEQHDSSDKYYEQICSTKDSV